MSRCVLIVDDHLLLTRAIHALLNCYSIPVCGEAQSGQEAIQRVKQLHPAVVILDVEMPVMNGIETASEIHKIAPQTKVVFFSFLDQPGPAMLRALGSDAWIAKSDAEDLVPALQRLLESGDHPSTHQTP